MPPRRGITLYLGAMSAWCTTWTCRWLLWLPPWPGWAWTQPFFTKTLTHHSQQAVRRVVRTLCLPMVLQILGLLALELALVLVLVLAQVVAVLVQVLVQVLVLVLVPVPVPVSVSVPVLVLVLALALVVTTTGRWTPRSTRVVCKPACLLQLAATGSGATRTSTDRNLACPSPLATQ